LARRLLGAGQRFSPEREAVAELIAAVAQIKGATLVHRDEHMRAIPAKLVRQQDMGAASTPD
jgi:predicted nucleic acid-binding protein